jgi:predicted O-methyltransferase YrrM
VTRGGPDPSVVVDLATAAWRTQVLFAALDLGLFDRIAAAGGGPVTVAALAADAGVPERGLELLLNAAGGLGLLEKAPDGTFRNAPAAAAFLVRASPAFFGGILGYARDAYGLWARLPQAVRATAPAGAPDYLGADPERTRRYVLGMYDNGMAMGRAVVAAIDLAGARHLLDVGGGPAAYAIQLCRRWPDLRVTVVELPAVAAIGREKVAEAGLADRITYAEGDMHTFAFESSHDAVLFAGVLHREPAERAAALVARAVASLPPGGRIVLSDVMLEGDGTRPVFAALFALNMLLTAPGGGAHRVEDHAAWLTTAGCEAVAVTRLPPPVPYTLVSGVCATGAAA